MWYRIGQVHFLTRLSLNEHKKGNVLEYQILSSKKCRIFNRTEGRENIKRNYKYGKTLTAISFSKAGT